MRIEVTSKEFVGRIVTITIDLPEGTDVKVLGKSVALDPKDAVPAISISGIETKEQADAVAKVVMDSMDAEAKEARIMFKGKSAEVKCPYHWKKQASKYNKWMHLRKVLGHAPSKEEMKEDHRGKHAHKAVDIAEDENRAEEDVEGTVPDADDPDTPMTDEMRYDAYVRKMNGEKPLCDECLDPIKKPSEAKHAGGLFFHIKCWKDR